MALKFNEGNGREDGYGGEVQGMTMSNQSITKRTQTTSQYNNNCCMNDDDNNNNHRESNVATTIERQISNNRIVYGVRAAPSTNKIFHNNIIIYTYLYVW